MTTNILDMPILEGKRVQLIPMQFAHAEELFEAACDPEIWPFSASQIESFEDMRKLVSDALTARDRGTEFPYSVFDKSLHSLVGSTRFLNISLAHRNLDIGWTWYTPEVWRTRVNTECKYLLLKHSFETLRTVRVQFKADVRNTRSNKAIERLGAVKEGVLRRDRILADGHVRDAIVYSIIAEEWEQVKARLENFLAR